MSRLPISPTSSPATDFQATPPLDVDLVIVGAGIVGATLACCLQASGLRIALVEAKPKKAGLQNRRAYAITVLSSDIFRRLGLWDMIAPRITACDRIRLSDADHPDVVWFTPPDLQRDHLVYVAEHNVLLEALYSQLEQSPNLHWLCPLEVVQVDYQPQQAIVTLRDEAGETRQVTSQLVVAADGARSPLREAAGIPTWGWGYWQSCLGFTVQTEKPHDNIAYERFWPNGPFAILPLPGQRCQIVWTAPHREAQRLAQLDEPEFLAQLQTRFGPQMGHLTLEGRPILFPVRLMQSRRYVQRRLALVGDAAHNCHPVGGQGLNLGIRDAAALAQVLCQAQTRQQDFGHPMTLQRYERWRQWENLTILGFTDLLDRVFSNQWLPLVWARRLGLRLLNMLPWARRMALRWMTGQRGRRLT